MSTRVCAGCARSLDVGGTGHGTYRVRGTTHTVLACSSACASIGAIVALVGAPPTKRTADDAELETAAAKAAALDTIHAADRDRLQMWLHAIDTAMRVFGNANRPEPTTDDLRNVVANIGAPMPGGRDGALAELQRLRDALQRVLDKIINNEQYDMRDIDIAVRNSLARLTEIEGQYYLNARRALENGSYLRNMPRELQTAVAQYATGGRRKPDATFSVRAGTLEYVGKFIYVRESFQSRIMHVFTFSGHLMQTSSTLRDLTSDVFEPAMSPQDGKLCMFYFSNDRAFEVVHSRLGDIMRVYGIPTSWSGRYAADAETNRVVALTDIDNGRTAQFVVYQLTEYGMEFVEQYRLPAGFLTAGGTSSLPVVLQFIDGQVLCKTNMRGPNDYLYTIVDLISGTVERVAILKRVSLRKKARIVHMTLVGRTHIICYVKKYNPKSTGAMMIPRTLLSGIITAIPIYMGPPTGNDTVAEFRNVEKFLSTPESRAPFMLYENLTDSMRFQTFIHRNRFHCAYHGEEPDDLQTIQIVDTFLLDHTA